jgi:Adenylate and Guanylate cyclase catalytic domain
LLELDEGQIDSISLYDRAVIRKWRRNVHYAFDCLCIEYGVIKIQTRGNSFVAVSGMQGIDDPNQAIKMAYFADACQKKLHGLLPLMKLDSTDKIFTLMRFGIHTGTCSGLCKALGQISDHQLNFRKLLDRARIMQKYVRAKMYLI